MLSKMKNVFGWMRSDCAPIKAAAIETLEQRKLLSITIPDGYEQVGSATSVDSTSSASVNTGITLESGSRYFIVASGVHRLAINPDRQADAQFWERNPGEWVKGSKPHF